MTSLTFYSIVYGERDGNSLKSSTKTPKALVKCSLEVSFGCAYCNVEVLPSTYAQVDSEAGCQAPGPGNPEEAHETQGAHSH